MVGDERNDMWLNVYDENQLSARRSGLHAFKPENGAIGGQPTNVTIRPRFVTSQAGERRSTLQALEIMAQPSRYQA
jgi:hypothetical protein